MINRHTHSLKQVMMRAGPQPMIHPIQSSKTGYDKEWNTKTETDHTWVSVLVTQAPVDGKLTHCQLHHHCLSCQPVPRTSADNRGTERNRGSLSVWFLLHRKLCTGRFSINKEHMMNPQSHTVTSELTHQSLIEDNGKKRVERKIRLLVPCVWTV